MESLLLFIVLFIIFSILLQKFEKQKKYIPEDGTKSIFERRISEEKTLAFRNLYFDLFRNRNINTVMNHMSDLLYQALNIEVKNLNRLGLKRDIRFIPKKEDERDESISVTEIGKYTVTEEKIAGSYQESLIDTTNDTVLWERKFTKSQFNMILSRNPNQKEKKEFYCQGCGSPIKLEGEQFICHNCGAKYSSDSYDWIIGDIKLMNEGISGGTSGEKSTTIKRNERSKKIGMAIGYSIFPILIFAFIFRNSIIVSTLFRLLFSIGNLGVVFGIIYYAVSLVPYKKMIEYDKMASPQKVNERAGYLVKRYLNTYQTSPNKMKAFMDSSFFEKWKSSIEVEEDQLVFSEPSLFKGTFKKFWVKNGRQYLKMNVATFNVYITPDKKIKESMKIVGLVLYRNENVHYKNTLDINAFYCTNCGMPMDLASDAKCKYCGTEYDLANYDWKIESICDVREETDGQMKAFFNQLFGRREEKK